MVQSVEHSVGDRCCFKTYQKERKAFGERIFVKWVLHAA